MKTSMKGKHQGFNDKYQANQMSIDSMFTRVEKTHGIPPKN